MQFLEPQHERSDQRDYALAPGSTLDGRFAIESVLGRGGMGYVLLAKHLELGQHVAIKVLWSNQRDDARQVTRALREARAAARIQSEHVVRVHDVVMGEAGPYIVMEYLKGRDLAQYLQEQGALSMQRAVQLVIQAAAAIGEGHELGIVHRDLKPANLFLCERTGAPPRVKVLDFGISKSLGDEADLLTQSHALLGSPLYAAPEQLECSRTVDARADIWSLGVILYELVSGKRPFANGSLAQVCTRILQQAPAPLDRARSNLPGAFVAVVMRCLEKDPARRYQSVQDLVAALAPFEPEASGACLAYLSALEPAAGGFSSGLSRIPTPSEDPTLKSDAATLTSSRSEQSLAKPIAARRSRARWTTFVVCGAAVSIGILARSSLLKTRVHPSDAPDFTAKPALVASMPTDVAPATAPIAPANAVASVVAPLASSGPTASVRARGTHAPKSRASVPELPWVESR